MTTLSYLVEAVRGDVDLPEDAAAVGAVNLRSLAGQVTQVGGAGPDRHPERCQVST
jgi:hypothetical protein